METVEIYFDGGCWPNPGPKGCWKYLICVGSKVYENADWIEQKDCTNNIAEYEGLLHALEKATELNLKDVVIYGDSNLVVQQINRRWKIKKDYLLEYAIICWKLLRKLNSWKLQWIPREQNIDADDLYNERHQQ